MRRRDRISYGFWLMPLGLLAGAAVAQSADEPGASPLQLSAGPGFVMTPRDPGSRHYRYLPIPDLAFEWQRTVFFDGRRGLGLYGVHNDQVDLGLSVFLRTGRKETSDQRLRGLGSISDAGLATVFARYRLAGLVDLSASASRDLGGSEGWTGTLEAGSFIPFSEAFTMIPAIAATFQDGRFARRWFGVDQAQSQRSGLPRFDAGSGIQSWAATLVFNYTLSDRWSIGQTASLSYLAGSAGHTPINDLRLQPTFATSLSYRFLP